MTIGERLKDARKHLGMTQKQLEKALGLKEDKVKNMETGTHKLTTDISELIEQKYSISGWWLLTGKGNMIVLSGGQIEENAGVYCSDGTVIGDSVGASHPVSLDEDEHLANLRKMTSKQREFIMLKAKTLVLENEIMSDRQDS